MDISDKFKEYKAQEDAKARLSRVSNVSNVSRVSSVSNVSILSKEVFPEQNENKFSYSISDENIWYMMESIHEIGKIKTLFKNYFKIQDKIININDFIQTFTSEKYEFISNMELFLSNTQFKHPNKDNYLSNHAKLVYTEIVKLFKGSLEELFTSYKILKQKISKKKGIAKKYWESKVAFLHENQVNRDVSVISDTKDARKESPTQLEKDKKEIVKANIPSKLDKYDTYNAYYTPGGDSKTTLLEPPKESWMLQYVPQDTKSADETVNILNDLSQLVRTFSQKVYHQSEMTNQSKSI